MRFYFTKMHGAGNDYVYLNCLDEKMKAAMALSGDERAALAVQMSRRHTGIGADGLIFILPSKRADCRMEMYNVDGSRGAMCGNGIRCVAWYLVKKELVKKRELTVETDSGIKKLLVRNEGNRLVCGNSDSRIMQAAATAEKCGIVRVDMGSMENLGEKRLKLDVELHVRQNMRQNQNKRLIPVQLVSAGNPHCVLFTEDIQEYPLEATAAQIGKLPEYAGGVNVEIAAVVQDALTGEKYIDMRVYERGTGETLACGTGACAVCAAAVWQGYCRYDENVELRLPGGILTAAYLADGRMMLEGPAEIAFEGVWENEK